MDSVLRAAAMYMALMVLFKIAGRRSLAELTTFDLLLLMIIGEATQQALLGDDFSLTNSMLVIVTLIAIDVGFSLLKQRSNWSYRLSVAEPTSSVRTGSWFINGYVKRGWWKANLWRLADLTKGFRNWTRSR